MTWKQFWCNHFWKEISRELLRQETYTDWETLDSVRHEIYAVNYECIKCHKPMVKEKKLMVI